MKPFYERSGIKIYCGDSLEIVPQLAKVTGGKRMTRYHPLAIGDIIRHTDGCWQVIAVNSNRLTLKHIGESWEHWERARDAGKLWPYLARGQSAGTGAETYGTQLEIGQTLRLVPRERE